MQTSTTQGINNQVMRFMLLSTQWSSIVIPENMRGFMGRFAVAWVLTCRAL
jgi:hypothetical protein